MSKKIVLALTAIMFSGNIMFAGGILTNTNQSVNFLRNPARDAAIGLDGVYSNPAGVAFLSDGLHLGFNWQYAHQTRTITSTNDLFMLGAKNNGLNTKEFEGVAMRPSFPRCRLPTTRTTGRSSSTSRCLAAAVSANLIRASAPSKPLWVPSPIVSSALLSS